MFTKIKTGFSNLDETINFGSRIVSDTKELCEICTLAVIPSGKTDQKVKDVSLRSSCKGGIVFLSIGNVFQIMNDKELKEQSACYVFDSNVTSFAVSPCGTFVLICSSDGNMVIKKHLESEDDVFQQKLDSEDESILDCFAHNDDFFVVSTRGSVSKILRGNENNQFKMENLVHLKKQITLCSLGDYCMYLQGYGQAYLLSLESNGIVTMNGRGFQKVYPIETNFLAISELGKLCLISSLGFIFKLQEDEECYEKLIVLEDITNSGKVNLVMVTKATELQNSKIQLVTYPDFEKQYSLNAPSPIELMQIEGLNGEVLFFWKVFQDGYLSEIRLQCVYEVDPLLKIERLNKKRQFEEAFKLAKLHDVNPEIVLKAKAEDFIIKENCTSADVDELLSILDRISEKLFRMNVCFLTDCQTVSRGWKRVADGIYGDILDILVLRYDTILETFAVSVFVYLTSYVLLSTSSLKKKPAYLGEDARRVLLYCINMDIGIRDTIQNRLLYPELQIKEQINQKLFKLDTYLTLYRDYDFEQWKQFFHNDLLDEMMKFLQQGLIEEANIICNRLDVSALAQLNLAKLEEIVNLFDTVSPDSIVFLTVLIPVTLKHLPSAFPLFISWLYERVYSLEKRLDFPKTAIKLVESVTNIINQSISNTNMYFEQNKENITRLYEALTDLSQLQEDYGVRVPLRGFLENPSDTIALLLRAGLSKENFRKMLSQFLCPYISRITTDRDGILLSEINCLLECDESEWIDTVPNLFEFIINDCNKLKAIEAILDAANIPWNENIRSISNIALSLSPSTCEISKIEGFIKNEQRLMVMSKYEIGKTDIQTSDDIEFFVNRILYVNNDTAVQDIYTICREEDVYRAEFTMIKKFVEKQKISAALKILDGNTPDRIVDLAETLLDLTLELIASKIALKYKKTYYDSSQVWWSRISKHCKDLSRKDRCQHTLENIHSLYAFKQNFGIVYKWKDIYNPTTRKAILDEQIVKVKESVENGCDIREFHKLCVCLASYLRLPSDEVLVKFMTVHDNCQLLLEIGEHLCETSTNSKTLSLAAVIMFRFLKSSLENDAEETFLDVTLSDTKNEDYLRSVKLARRLIIQAMLYATSEDDCAVMEVARWVNSCYYLTNVDQKCMQKSNTYSFCNALEGIKRTFNVYCLYIEGLKHPNTRYLTYFHQDGSDAVMSSAPPDFNEFFVMINRLLKEGHHMTAYHMIKTLQQSFCYDGFKNAIVQNLQTFINEKWFPQTLQMVVSAGNTDKALLFNVFLVYGKNFAKPLTKLLSSFRQSPSKLADVAEVGVKLTEIYNIEGKEKLVNCINICKWWNKLNNNQRTSKISFEAFFKFDHESRMKHLILEEQLDASNVTTYCEEFNIGNAESVYSKLLEITLSTWTPQFEVKTDMFQRKTIELKNGEEELLDKCWEIIQKIKNKDAVFELTEKLWPTVNFYYYEVYLVLLEIQRCLPGPGTPNGPLYSVLLKFLRKYTRVAAPSSSEKENWFATFPNSPFIDPLSEFRLPLHSSFLSGSIWKIIKPEVNLTTYEKWLNLSRFVKVLDRHDICVYAIKSVTESRDFQSNVENPWPENEWDLDCHDQLITEVDNCARNMSDLEKATAAVYNLMCGMPLGIDKLKMAELSYKYALLYTREIPNEATQKVALKVKNRYHKLSAMHILHKYNLADKNYLLKVLSPCDLVSDLYKDPRILKTVRNNNCICPDINGAVGELTSFFEIDKNETKYLSLIENLSTDLQGSNNVDNLKRACYICSEDKAFWRNVLYQIGLKNQYPYPEHVSAKHQDFAFKANALKCLYYISSPEIASEMTGTDPEDFLIMIEKMDLISMINSVGLFIENMDHLENMPKNKLLKDIARQNVNQETVRCMAKVCKVYEIDDMKYWEFILKTATKLEMVKDLREYVEELKFRNVTEAFQNAWKLIVRNAFSRDDESDSRENMFDVLTDSIRILQTCPVLYALDIEYYIEKCISRKFFEFAAVLFQYLPKEKLNIYIEQISSPTLLQDVANLRLLGILGTNRVVNILSVIV